MEMILKARWLGGVFLFGGVVLVDVVVVIVVAVGEGVIGVVFVAGTILIVVVWL